MIVCTIVARNYLAQARVLAESYAAHHPGELLRVLVVDAETDGSRAPRDEPFELIVPSQLPLDEREFRLMAAIYDVTELSTAVKPWLLQHLVGDQQPVVYLDPDIEVFAPLTELDGLAREGQIVLIPHTRTPVPNDGRKPTVEDLARAGVYNLGFLAVSAAAADFLEWWSGQLRRDCLIAPEEGLFVDQRLLDAVPAYYEHRVLRDAAWNVAYWNLHERDLRWTGGGYEVEGQPLRFFHFSGFDPERPDLLSKHQGDRPRILLEERTAVRRICGDYARKLLAAGHRELATQPYGFAQAADGTPLDRPFRRAYRDAVLAAGDDGLADLPDPFDPSDTDRFRVLAEATGRAARARTRAALFLDAGHDIPSARALARPFHRAINRALSHHDLHQTRVDAALLEALNELDREIKDLLEQLTDDLTRLEQRIDDEERAINDRLAQLARAAEELRGHLGRLEAELTARPYTTGAATLVVTDEHGRPQIGYRGGPGGARPGYVGFEDLFRGSEELVRERQRVYLDVLHGNEPVFDVGCGRGELLDLLAAAGIRAWGVDLDADMAALARSKGHRVEHADGVTALEALEEMSLGAIFSAQVVEHLPYEQLLRLLRLARSKLRPAGLLVLETVNPHSPQARKAFWVDPTHVRPLFPEALVALCRAEGFESAVVIFPNGSGRLEEDLRSAGDYAVVATRAAEP